MFTGPVLFPAGLDPANTKTAMVVLGPGGGQINVPPLAQGEAGPSPTILIGTPQTLPPGSAATAELPIITPAQPGVGPVYELDLGIPTGAQGPAFETQIIDASDLTGTPAAGYTIVYVPAQGNTPAQTAWAAMPFSSVYNVPNIPDTNTVGGELRTLATISVPAQPFLWVPIIFAMATVTGTADCQVNLVARQNNGSSGNFSGSQVAKAQGQLGTGPATLTTIPAFTGTLAGDAGSGVIPANTVSTFYLNAEQQAPTTDEYSTSEATYFLGVLPLGIISSSYVAVDQINPDGVAVVNNNATFSNTVGANDNYVIVAVGVASPQNYLLLGNTVTYGGQKMTLLGITQAGGDAYAALWGLSDPPVGPQTVAVGATGQTVNSLIATAVSFQRWAQTSIGYATGLDDTQLASDAVFINAGQLAFCVFVSLGATPIEVTSSNTTTLFQKQGTAGELNLLIASAPGAGNFVELTATTSASQPWAAVMVTLI